MQKPKLYLDMCCFNRPYDNQQQERIYLESVAKLYVQKQIVQASLDFAWSFILEYENSKNPYALRRQTIKTFSHRAAQYISEDFAGEITPLAKSIMDEGIKAKDALHVACAVWAGCDFFLTTDDRLLKYNTSSIRVVNPMQFVCEMEG